MHSRLIRNVANQGENRIEPTTARSGFANPLHRYRNGMDIFIQVLDSRRSRSRVELTTSNLRYNSEFALHCQSVSGFICLSVLHESISHIQTSEARLTLNP